MFAFVIVDFANDLLFAARDRAGEKPLYYYETDERAPVRLRDQGHPHADTRARVNLTDEYDAFEYMSGERHAVRRGEEPAPGPQAYSTTASGTGAKGRSISEYWNVLDNIREIDPASCGGSARRTAARLGSAQAPRRTCRWDCICPEGSTPPCSPICFARRCATRATSPTARSMTSSRTPPRWPGTSRRSTSSSPPRKDDFERQPAVDHVPPRHAGRVLQHVPVVHAGPEGGRASQDRRVGEGADELFSGYARYLVLVQRAGALRDAGAPDVQAVPARSYLGRPWTALPGC